MVWRAKRKLLRLILQLLLDKLCTQRLISGGAKQLLGTRRSNGWRVSARMPVGGPVKVEMVSEAEKTADRTTATPTEDRTADSPKEGRAEPEKAEARTTTTTGTNNAATTDETAAETTAETTAVTTAATTAATATGVVIIIIITTVISTAATIKDGATSARSAMNTDIRAIAVLTKALGSESFAAEIVEV